MAMLKTWWPALFSLGTMGMMFFVDPSPKVIAFPPQLELTGAQAKRVMSSPWFFGVAIPMVVGLVWIRSFAKSRKLSADETGSMVWWLVNLFWFHSGCDIFSGLIQTQAVLTELYIHMNPSHSKPMWHDARGHLDAGYALELVVEVPLAAWVLYLFARQDPARHIVEVFAAAVQFAGTVAYYAPGVAKGESHGWLSWADRSCGAVWIIFPAILLRRHVKVARSKGGKSKGGKAA
mmetsp:Transcript_64540/g.180445  ORF Transcript_64540/g.180445 Transcript_64540/m.180445 type:complete len:234 (-) Transcript_64540:111-812(-)